MAIEEQQQQEAQAAVSQQEEFVKNLEEDDEFEDFPEDEWEEIQSVSASNDAKLWEESWEDHDEYKDDFTNRLRAELEKSSTK